jgi:orotidine-5'-phosphate decarboxylase
VDPRRAPNVLSCPPMTPNPTRLSTKSIPRNERLIVALDVPTHADAKRWAMRLGDDVRFYKLGLELLMSDGYFALIDDLMKMGKRVLADLKVCDVPETVERTVHNLHGRPGLFVTFHAIESVIQAACKAKNGLRVLAVTVMTSLDKNDLVDMGMPDKFDVEDLVLSRARRALELGADGIISSGLEIPRLREHVGDRPLIVSPGIRPFENRLDPDFRDDQKRVVDVETAFLNGADYIIVGRPILRKKNPTQAAKDIQDRIARLFPNG